MAYDHGTVFLVIIHHFQPFLNIGLLAASSVQLFSEGVRLHVGFPWTNGVFQVKQYHRPDCNAFDVFGRVMSGTVFRGDRVKILGALPVRNGFFFLSSFFLWS